MTFIAAELRGIFDESSLFSQVSALEGEVFRDVPGRRTFRVVLGGKAYFAKVHFGVGWREIFKNLLQLRLPVLGASNEWRAINKLQSLGVETLKTAAYTTEGINPAQLRSCIMTEALDNTISLEDLVLEGALTLSLKRELIVRIANIARTIHTNGLNHRDFYICHFLLSRDSLKVDRIEHLHLIDLHRVQIRSQAAPKRWMEKDLAGLLFSAADAQLTQRDVLRFIRQYSGSSLRQSLSDYEGLWRQVLVKAARLYEKDHGEQSEFLTGLRIEK